MLVILDKLNFYLRKFWKFLKPRRKLGLVSFVVLTFLVLTVVVVGVKVAHAQAEILTGGITSIPGVGGVLGGVVGDVAGDAAGGIAQAIFNLVVGLIMAVAGWFIKLTFFILAFVIEVAGYNRFIDSPAVIVGWVMVRDITNMFFVVVLLVISFGTILGLEQYEYKKLLVKLLMAAIIVNFSRIICGIIIDIAQIVMITFVNGIAATASGNMATMFGVDKIFSFSKNENLAQQVTGGNGEIFLAAVASVTFAAIMMMTMLTFLFLLVARMVMLWILIVLSPFAFVLNVLPQTQTYAGQWWKDFSGNVIAGPVVAFFLWLSFVTVGAGNIHDEISNGNPQAITAPGKDAQETSTGLTAIMSWEQMANFAIAIGMLLGGAKMAQQLGAAGGSMMGKAGEFGKKVAMIASGATAARWAGRQALAGGKKVGAYGLGLAAEPFKRQGRAIKAWASYKTNEKGWFGLPSRKSRLVAAAGRIDMLHGTPNKVDLNKVDEGTRDLVAQRNAALAIAGDKNLTGERGEEQRKQALEESDEMRKKLEMAGYSVAENEEGETELKEKETSFKKRALARVGLFFAPEAFKEEYTKDKESRAKYTEEQLEHIVSTSKTPIGKEKTRAEAELLRLKATGQDIKARKIQDVLEQLTGTEKGIMKAREEGKSWDDVKKMGYSDVDISHAKRADNAIKSSAQAEQIEKKLATEKELKKLEAIRELLATQVGESRGKEATTTKAALEQLTFDYEQVKAQKAAIARDELLESQNRFSEANNYENTINTQVEERIKKHSGAGDFVQSVAKTDAQLKRISQQKQRLAGAVAKGDKKEEEEARGVLGILEKSLSEMQLSNLGVHAAVADSNRAKILEAAGMSKSQNMDITPTHIRELQAQDLAELTGGKVEATLAGLEQAMKRFVEIHGAGMANSVLEQKRLRNEKAAGQGSLARAGLYKIRDKGDGKFETVLTNADSADDQEYVKNRRTAGLSGFKITSALGLSGSMDRDAAGNAVIKSGASKEILLKVIGGVTANQTGSVDEYTKGDLAQIFDNSDLIEVQNILKELQEKVGDKTGLKRLLTFVLEKDRMKNTEKIDEVKALIEKLGSGEKKSKK